MTDRSEALTQASAPVVPQDGSYVDWPAIFAGATVASAIAFVFSSFGAALGLSLISPYEGEGFATAAILAAGTWMLWTTVSSFMTGGYIAGRMRRRVDSATADEVDVRDGVHGIAVWAVGVIIGAMLLSSAVSTTAKVGASVASGTAAVASSVASGAGNAVQGAAGAVLPDDVDLDPVAYVSDAMFRSNGEAPSGRAMRARTEAREIMASLMTTGEIQDDEKEYLYSLVAGNTELTEEEVKAQVDRAVEAAQTARTEAVQAAEAAEQAARDAAEAARVYSVISAFVLAAALLIAAASAYWAAGIGGRHRDEGRTFDHFGRWE